MAPIHLNSIENDLETISGRQNGVYRQPTFWYSFLSCFWLTSISGWLTSFYKYDPPINRDGGINARKPLEEISSQAACFVTSPDKDDCIKPLSNSEKTVDEEEVELYYQWVVKTLKDESVGNITRRYRLLIEELWNLLFQGHRSDEFLKALVERSFPTAKTITGKSDLFDQANEADSSHCVEKPIGNIVETKNDEEWQDDVLSMSYRWQADGPNKNEIGKKKQENQIYTEYEIKEVDEKTRENGIPPNDPVCKLDMLDMGVAQTGHNKKPEVVSVPGDKKNGSDPNIQGTTTERSSQTNGDQNQSLVTYQSGYNGVGKGYGGSGDDGDQPSQTIIDISKGHYEENPVPITETNIYSDDRPIETQTNGRQSQLQLSPDSNVVMSADTSQLGNIAEYENMSRIGEGAFGICDLCYNSNTKSYLVKKKVKRSSFDMNEITIWKTLCPSGFIIPLYGFVMDNDHVSMFMEPMDGTFQDIVDKHEVLSLSEKEVTAMVKHVLNALAYIHEKNIVHCDIKCQNIFYKENSFQIKIGDFGLSVLLHEMSIPNPKVRGTPNHMAYEMCRNMSFGRSADIWSLGCVLIHLLTGRLPWSDYEMYQIIYKVGSGGTPIIPNTCSVALKQVLETMLRHDKIERPTAIELLHHPVFEIDLEDDLMNLFYRMLQLRVDIGVDLTLPSIIQDNGENELAFGPLETPMSLCGLHDANVLHGKNQAETEGLMDVKESEGGLFRNSGNVFQPPEMFSSEER